jgi:hypothetical protein
MSAGTRRVGQQTSMAPKAVPIGPAAHHISRIMFARNATNYPNWRTRSVKSGDQPGGSCADLVGHPTDPIAGRLYEPEIDVMPCLREGCAWVAPARIAVRLIVEACAAGSRGTGCAWPPTITKRVLGIGRKEGLH